VEFFDFVGLKNLAFEVASRLTDVPRHNSFPRANAEDVATARFFEGGMFNPKPFDVFARNFFPAGALRKRYGQWTVHFECNHLTLPGWAATCLRRPKFYSLGALGIQEYLTNGPSPRGDLRVQFDVDPQSFL
jgi:hypothetical protein